MNASYLILILCFVALNSSKSQCLTGLNGLVSIPTAEIPADGRVSVGVSYYDKDYLNLYGSNYNGLGTYINISFLPFIEVGFRFTRLIDFPDKQALGDRMPSIRIRLIEEGDIFPSLLLGAHDFLTSTENKYTSYNASTYLAITKNVHILPGKVILKLNAGHGFRILKAASYQFEGLFYGISFKLYDFTEVMVENDSKNFNAGLRLSGYGFSLTGGVMSFKYLSGTCSYSFQL